MPIIVHIGPPKTASTTIQKALEFNVDNVLNENNIQYIINSKCNNDVLFFTANIDSPFPREYNQPDSFKPKVYKEDAELFLKKLKKSHKKNKIYISSSEYLFRLSFEEINNLKKKLSDIDNDIEILCFIRDPIQHNLSYMAENIKSRIAIRNPSDYINTYDQINSWEAAFGLNFHVYSFEDSIKGEDGILGYFSNCINKILVAKGIKTNISLNSYSEIANKAPCIELLKATHQYRIKNKLEENVYSPSLTVAKNKISKEISKLEKSLGTKADYSEIAKTFFINENKSLYELLENKYDYEFNYEWKNYLDKENYKNLRNTIWDFDNMIKSYNKDLAELFLIHLEMSTKGTNINLPKSLMIFIRRGIKIKKKIIKIFKRFGTKNKKKVNKIFKRFGKKKKR